LDLIAPQWREKRIRNLQKVVNFLDSYRWSSHLDYCGKKNFPSVTKRDFLLSIFGGEKGYQGRIKEWLGEMELEEISGLILE